MVRIHYPVRVKAPGVVCLLFVAAIAVARQDPQPAPAAGAEDSCAARELTTVGDIPVFSLPGDAVLYESHMMIDADGAPTAYHPNDEDGLDDLSNAGEPGHWWALATDENGEPIVQGPDDPAPGFYVSMTALWDRTKSPRDPRRYVDATAIPYISIPTGLPQVRVGDFAVVRNRHNGQMSYAIVADMGPTDKIGEGSIALAEALGVRSSARRGGIRDGIQYLIFSYSGDRQPRPLEEINAAARDLFSAWGGSARLDACQEQLQTQDAKTAAGDSTGSN